MAVVDGRRERRQSMTADVGLHGIWVDERWGGNHGIGRYATEIVRRIPALRPLGLDGRPSSALVAFRRLPRDARREVVYSPGYNPLLRAGREILTIHDLIHLEVPGPRGQAFRAYYNALVRPMVRRAGVVITVSETSRGRIAQWLDDESVEIVNAGIGVSDAFRDSGPADEQEMSYVQYVGNNREHKNVDVVLRALAQVDDLALRMLVPRADAPGIQTRAAELGIADRVSFMHDVDDVELARAYRGAVATVMPSTQEGFGLPPLESIMCGTPVVYWAGCAAVRETVGSSGLGLDDERDAGAWAEALRDASQHRRRVTPPPVEAYSWDRTAAMVRTTLIGRAS
jgi:glycosyltransferase involved in cell wall biosynthesis